MKQYAVLHKPSGKYLPPNYDLRKNSTSLELSKVPRLFPMVRAAKCAATWYVTGIVTSQLTSNGDGELQENWTVKKVVERRLKDFFVVPVYLIPDNELHTPIRARYKT